MLTRTLPRSLPPLDREPPDLEQGAHGASSALHRAALCAEQLRPNLPRPIQPVHNVRPRLVNHENYGRYPRKKFEWLAGATLVTAGAVMLGVGLRNGIPHPTGVFEPFAPNDPLCQPTSKSPGALCEGQFVGTTSGDVNYALAITGGVVMGCGVAYLVLDKLCWGSE